MRKAIPTPRIIGTRVRGSVKFGWIPGGGGPAGSVLSKAGGMLPMSLGSRLPADIDVKNDQTIMARQEQLPQREPTMDLMYFPVAIKRGPSTHLHCPQHIYEGGTAEGAGVNTGCRAISLTISWGPNSGLAPVSNCIFRCDSIEEVAPSLYFLAYRNSAAIFTASNRIPTFAPCKQLLSWQLTVGQECFARSSDGL